ncbi:MAG: BtpA/SgcQ family protein [Polyangiaceae bacterium]
MKHPRLLTGVIHLAPLPGSPRSSRTVSEIAKSAAADARALQDAGFDLVMIENFGDAPFFRGEAPPVTIAAMTACAVAVRTEAAKIPIGINILRNDVAAALAIASVVGAKAVRVNVHSGARVTDQGIVEGRAAETLRLRKSLAAEDVEIWADIDVKHSAPLAARPIEDEAIEVSERALADALLVTGTGTGVPVDGSDLVRVRKAVPEAKIYVASGTRLDDLKMLSEHATGIIVGSALRTSGKAGDPIDRAIAEKFANAFRKTFS